MRKSTINKILSNRMKELEEYGISLSDELVDLEESEPELYELKKSFMNDVIVAKRELRYLSRKFQNASLKMKIRWGFKRFCDNLQGIKISIEDRFTNYDKLFTEVDSND